MFRRIANMLTLLSLFLVAACAGSRVPPTTERYTEAPPAFVLGAGDRLRVIVFGETTVTGEYPVGTDGTISLPLVGPIRADGQTTEQLRAVIASRLAAGYINEPRVTVDVMTYRPYFILGEVTRPGQYPYGNALSVAQAVAAAGGYTYRANSRRVFIRRAGKINEEAFALNFDRQIWVMPGDTIRVGERYF